MTGVKSHHWWRRKHVWKMTGAIPTEANFRCIRPGCRWRGRLPLPTTLGELRGDPPEQWKSWL